MHDGRGVLSAETMYKTDQWAQWDVAGDHSGNCLSYGPVNLGSLLRRAEVGGHLYPWLYGVVLVGTQWPRLRWAIQHCQLQIHQVGFLQGEFFIVHVHCFHPHQTNWYWHVSCDPSARESVWLVLSGVSPRMELFQYPISEPQVHVIQRLLYRNA